MKTTVSIFKPPILHSTKTRTSNGVYGAKQRGFRPIFSSATGKYATILHLPTHFLLFFTSSLTVFPLSHTDHTTTPFPSTPTPTPTTLQNNIIPRSLKDVDNGKILGFSADLSPHHPGYNDTTYKHRRISITKTAATHQIGHPIPTINYNPEEIHLWGTVLTELQQLFPHHACRHFLETVPTLDFQPDVIPQLEDLSQLLQHTTGWQIRPVAGLLHPKDFLAGLAFKAFHSTQYIRHSSGPNYTPEPDIIHELVGHVPMLMNPAYCDLVHHIGLASLAADDKQRWHLTKCYWYTVEFGVVREHQHQKLEGGSVVKAFGAGILSSTGELRHLASGNAELVPFDPFQKLPAMSYKDGYQKQYFVLESFEDGAEKLKAYCDYLMQGVSPEKKAIIQQIAAAASGSGSSVYMT